MSLIERSRCLPLIDAQLSAARIIHGTGAQKTAVHQMSYLKHVTNQYARLTGSVYKQPGVKERSLCNRTPNTSEGSLRCWLLLYIWRADRLLCLDRHSSGIVRARVDETASLPVCPPNSVRPLSVQHRERYYMYEVPAPTRPHRHVRHESRPRPRRRILRPGEAVPGWSLMAQ